MDEQAQSSLGVEPGPHPSRADPRWRLYLRERSPRAREADGHNRAEVARKPPDHRRPGHPTRGRGVPPAARSSKRPRRAGSRRKPCAAGARTAGRSSTRPARGAARARARPCAGGRRVRLARGGGGARGGLAGALGPGGRGSGLKRQPRGPPRAPAEAGSAARRGRARPEGDVGTPLSSASPTPVRSARSAGIHGLSVHCRISTPFAAHVLLSLRATVGEPIAPNRP
jgi:hypothetical protein